MSWEVFMDMVGVIAKVILGGFLGVFAVHLFYNLTYRLKKRKNPTDWGEGE
jgi:hypothetical protein